jgi:hypothetical protein
MDYIDTQSLNFARRFYRANLLSSGAWTRLNTTPIVGKATGTNYFTNNIGFGAGQLRLSSP